MTTPDELSIQRSPEGPKSTAGPGEAPGNDHDAAIRERIGDWAKRLLQLDRRNNLLYFKPGRSAVGITSVSPNELDERLRRARRGLEFPYVPPFHSRRRGFVPQDESETTDGPTVQRGDLTTDCDPFDLQRRLRNLQRKDREWEEEQGLNVLFLAVGFLNWVDEDGEQARSPLMLIPCDLERASPRDPYRLVREDDDSTDNPTLRLKLALQGIDLPEFRGDSAEDESIEAYIDSLDALVGGREGWSVDHEIALGTFSYSKLSMYEDLARMIEHGVQSDLTRVLAGAEVETGEATSDRASSAPRDTDLVGGRLDDLLDLRDQFTVLAADFSQLRAIEEARRGGNLVIHGPPGTGKSQTIANLIATLIADGKRVLFVSEKTAALDVVKRRLEECDLGVFCLDLHSDRARKGEVYRQLRASVGDDRTRLAVRLSIDELIERRDRLNSVVRLLHERREPLGKSVQEVQGLFALDSHLPSLNAFKPPQISELTAEWVRGSEEEAGRITRRPEEFLSHFSSRWLPLRIPQPSLQLAELIRRDMTSVQSAIHRLCSKASPVSEWTGVPAVESADDARRLVRLLGLLARGPTIPSAWLNRQAVGRLRRLSLEQAEQQGERIRLKQAMSGWFGDTHPPVDYLDVARALDLTPEELEAIEAVAGKDWRTGLGRNPGELLERATTLAKALARLAADIETVETTLAEEGLHTLGHLEQASALATRILHLEPVPEQWLTFPAIAELERETAEARKTLERLVDNEAQLNEKFSSTLVELVDEQMLVRYRTDHQSFLRRFRGAYRSDQRTLRGQLRTPRKLSFEESLADVELAVEVKHQRKNWQDMELHLRESLGSRFRGRETDWKHTFSDLAAVRDILTDSRGGPNVQRELLAAESVGDRRRALDLANHTLRDDLARYRLAVDALDHKPLLAPSLEVAQTGDVVRRSLVPLRRVSETTVGIYRNLATPLANFDELNQLIHSGAKLNAVVDEDQRLAPSLAQDFGAFFQREETDWKAVSAALDWTAKFLDSAHGRVGDTLAGHATAPRTGEEYESRANSSVEAIAEFTESLGMLDQRFDRAAAGWPSWDSRPFVDLESWSADLHEHAGSALAWVEYREAVHDLDKRLGAGSADALRTATEDAEEVPGTVRRAIYSSWLEAIYDAEPVLRGFSAVDHESVRSQFRELDERYPYAARQRVRERVFARYPDQYETPLQRGQLGTLNGELSKRTRLMPVRRLIARIPNLLQTLKPCFLMSPLAASQYLPAGPLATDHLEFDTVIFDEASQILPEDALPAIDRGRQVIVVGDRLQLPPTNFFRTSLGSDDDLDDDDEEDQDSFEGRESILDVMVGQVGDRFAERYLSVHYRSRCESLIRFSNHAFYENRLLTFPSPEPAATAVRDVHLPDATYDMGRTRTNRDEAKRVRDIVFELMATQPNDESIGVVTLSRSQSDLIESLIEERRLLNRHLDYRFSEERLERFFVKNLENVQGDERDHMILSICYGPTPSGRVPNRFGPINQDGGERRLNVAVTRARKSMTVVHSLRAEDITSEQPGARQLRRYLEFVRNPERAFEAEVTGSGDPESPFEEAVLAALRMGGHRVDAQVGVSGYRIDLAIKSGDGKRYDLGVECDGATYHSSPTARDRDWLRQQVLERLGWRIHRVWSTSWIRDPGTEVAAIEQALKQARSSQTAPSPTTPSNRVLVKRAVSQGTPTPAVVPQRTKGSQEVPQLFDEYRQYEGQVRRGDLLEVPSGDLVSLVRDVISVEQPIHIDDMTDRVRSTYGVPRLGKNMRLRIIEAVEQMATTGVVLRDEPDDVFLILSENTGPSRPRRNGGRTIRRVAPSEIDEGLLMVASKTFGSEQYDLVRETARQFGWRRTGQEIERRLSEGVERLLKSGRLSSRANMLLATDDRS